MVIITAYILLIVISVRTVVVLTCLGKIILRKIYYDPTSPASFSGPDKLYVYVKKDGKYNISKYKIKKWLQRQEIYSTRAHVGGQFGQRSRLVAAHFALY